MGSLQCPVIGLIVPVGRKGGGMKSRVQMASIGSLMAGLIFGISGCASDAPKPTSTVTPEQVRGHADKAFEKLKQEEQGRSSDPAMPR